MLKKLIDVPEERYFLMWALSIFDLLMLYTIIFACVHEPLHRSWYFFLPLNNPYFSSGVDSNSLFVTIASLLTSGVLIASMITLLTYDQIITTYYSLRGQYKELFIKEEKNDSNKVLLGKRALQIVSKLGPLFYVLVISTIIVLFLIFIKLTFQSFIPAIEGRYFLGLSLILVIILGGFLGSLFFFGGQPIMRTFKPLSKVYNISLRTSSPPQNEKSKEGLKK